ncbi:MAG: TonB-dependent receptor plug domain-containing protein [Bacteroidales bacterium]|nr:TonB-dependent receptor plug domain-containing protein [Bacteroidales bacterium]
MPHFNDKYDKKVNYRLFHITLILIVIILFHNQYEISAQISNLSDKTIEIDSVVIRAKKETRNLMKRPYTEPNSIFPSISKLTFAEIKRQGATNLVEAMNYIPGGLIETRGRQVKQFFSVRGQKYPYPDYAIDGVWQKEFEELPYFFSTSDIEEIEVVRSSAALLTGLSGMAGLINVKTREYNKMETNIEMEYGSYNSLHTHLSNGSKIGNLSYSAGIGYDKSDGPTGSHSKENMADLFTQVKWQPSEKLSVKANLFYLNGKRELRIAELPADKRYRDMIQNFNPVQAVLTNLKTVYSPNEKLSSELQIFYSYRNPTFNDEVKLTSSNEKDSEYGFNFIQSVAVTNFNIIRFGALYNHWIAPNGKRFYTGKRCDTETFSAVLVDEQRIGRVTLDAGVRLTRTYMNDYGAFNIEGDGAAFKNVTSIQDQWEPAIIQGSLGASYRINNLLSAYFNSAAGQVKPRQGSLTTELNVPLNELRYKFDLGIVRTIGINGKVSATAFGVVQNDAIALSGDTYLDAATSIRRELYVNRDQEQYGIELEIMSPEVYRMFEPFLNLTIMKSALIESGTRVTNKENPVLISSGGIYFKKKNIDINLLGKYISKFENDRFAAPADGPQPLGDFFTADINGGYTFKGKIPVRVYFKVKNISDKRYSTVIGYPDFGRMIYGGIQIKFG